MTYILVLGKHPEVMAVVLRLLRDSGRYEADGVFSAEELGLRLEGRVPDLILVGGGVSAGEEEAVRRLERVRVENIPLLRHYGGGSGLLFNELARVFGEGDS